MKVLYLLSDYPLVTTTFVDREILTLRRLGIEVEVVASRPPPPGTPLSATQHELQRGVRYLWPPSWTLLIASQLHYLLTSPYCLIVQAVRLLVGSHPSWKARASTVLHIVRGVYGAFLLRSARFDKLHVHFAFGNATSAIMIARLLRRPYTISIHAGTDVYANPVLLVEKIAGAEHVVTCTRYNKAYLESLVEDDISHRVTFIPHGLDLSRYRMDGARPSGQPLILAVGTLLERKGFPHLIRACSLLKRRGLDFVCNIVGEGPERSILEGLIRDLSLQDCVFLLGSLKHDDVIEQYRRASIFALPCVQAASGDLDGIPNVVAEAMAMELPVVSSKISGVPELVEHEISGMLIPPGDEEALAVALARLLGNRALCRSLGQSARRKVEQTFDLERNTIRLAETLWPELKLTPQDLSLAAASR